MMWFVKSRRASSVDDYETWRGGGVIPTLNVMDNSGESRATVLIINDEEPVVMRDREGKAGGGKGALISTTAFTLATSNFHTIFPNSATVRRLTPVECERLQGFPDNWTVERYDEKKNVIIAQADSARYKQMGNAVAVPVVEWIIERMLAVIPTKTINDINKENVESDFSSTDEDASPLTPTQKAGQ